MKKLITVFLLSIQFIYLCSLSMPIKSIMLNVTFCDGDVITFSGLLTVVRENTMDQLYTLAQLSGICVNEPATKKSSKHKNEENSQKQPTAIIVQNIFSDYSKQIVRAFNTSTSQIFADAYTNTSILVNFLGFLLFLSVFLNIFRLKFFYIHIRSSIDHLYEIVIATPKNPA